MPDSFSARENDQFGAGPADRAHAREVEVNGRDVWVLEDDGGVSEVADSQETLARDHPEVAFDED